MQQVFTFSDCPSCFHAIIRSTDWEKWKIKPNSSPNHCTIFPSFVGLRFKVLAYKNATSDLPVITQQAPEKSYKVSGLTRITFRDFFPWGLGWSSWHISVHQIACSTVSDTSLEVWSTFALLCKQGYTLKKYIYIIIIIFF